MSMYQVEFQVSGDYALFSDPVTRTSGQKCSYSVPTYEALKGIMKGIYWKPTIQWYIDSVRVMNPIAMCSRGIRPIHYQNQKNDLAFYTYLENVCYQVRAHFEWNENRPEYACDRDPGKHQHIASDSILSGGRRPLFLGTSDCPCVAEPCVFGSGEGFYDSKGDMPLGAMLHGITYPDEAYSYDTQGQMTVGFWHPVMRSGIIRFIRPEDCRIKKAVRPMPMKRFKTRICQEASL